MTVGHRTYLLADLSLAAPSTSEEIDALAGASERETVGGQAQLLVQPTYLADAPALERLVVAGLCSFVRSPLSASALAAWIASVSRVIEPRRGRLMALQLLVPAVLCFTLLHADRALADRMAEGFAQVTVRGTDAALYRAEFAPDRLRVVLLHDVSRSVLRRDAVVPAQFRELALPAGGTELAICALSDPATLAETHGTFPELTPDFMEAFEKFQRRLCIRRLAGAEQDVLFAPLTLEAEDRILSLARRCGYWDELVFDRMAFAALVLGIDRIDDPDRFDFRCTDDPHPFVAKTLIEDPFRYAQLRARQIRDRGTSPMDEP